MKRSPRASLLALFLFLLAPVASASVLKVRLIETGKLLAQLPVSEGHGWCILWHHSVQGFEVEDCYENQSGRMVLVRSHLPDFAAGLDHIPGRGRQVSDGHGGYFIEELNEPVPGNAYIIRPGGPRVDHRLRTETREISLTALAERARVQIALEPEGD